MRRIYGSFYVWRVLFFSRILVCINVLMSIVFITLFDNKHMEREHVKPVIEFGQRQWNYYNTIEQRQ